MNLPPIHSLWNIFSSLSALAILLSGVLYLLPLLYLSIFASRPQNLKKKYDAQYAVVTGGSSGIGKASTKALLEQGINVFVVALDDQLLTNTISEFSQQFPDTRVVPIAVNLGRDPDDYMDKIRAATDDFPVSVCINNAGYLLMGFFHDRSVDQHISNIECNQLACVRITHHFYSRMVAENLRGCVTFTSSAAHFMPAPFASMYAATKAFLSHFATSLAIEAEAYGIDICVIHPSYTHTNLYASTPKLDVVTFLSKFGWTPENVADVILSSVGRVIVRDAGWYAVVTNILGRIVDPNALSKVIIPFRDSMAPEGAVKKKNA